MRLTLKLQASSKECIYWKISFPISKTYVAGTQKDNFNETVLLRTQNKIIMLKPICEKTVTIFFYFFFFLIWTYEVATMQ